MQNVSHEDLYKICNGTKVKVEKWNDLEEGELFIKRLRSKNTFKMSTKTTISYRNWKICKNATKTLRKELNKLVEIVSCQHFIHNFSISFFLFLIFLSLLCFSFYMKSETITQVNGMGNTKSQLTIPWMQTTYMVPKVDQPPKTNPT